MKKLFVLAVVTVASASAFASKARLDALQNARHLSDPQDVVGHSTTRPVQPDQALNHGEWVTFEWGSNRYAGVTSPAAVANGNRDVTRNAEGGFVRKIDDNAAMGAYLGNKSEAFNTFRNLAILTTAVADTPASGTAGTGSTALLNQNNPLNLYYASKAGDMQWGLGFFYVNSDRKTTKQKENIMGLNASVSGAGGWDAQLTVGLGAESKNETTSGSEVVLKGGSNIQVSGGYKMDTMYFHGMYKTLGAKLTTGTTENANWDISGITVGVVNSHKKDAADFFYGISYDMSTVNNKTNTTAGKTETTMLPVIVGVEAEATSWLVLRGSVTQNVLMGSTKTGTGDADTIADNTTVAAGAGLKFGKFLLDGTFTNANSTGATSLGSDTGFVTNVGMTYNF